MTKEEIGNIIRESRNAAGLTQLQVANALDRPQNTISAWEMGRAQPDANTLFELFQVLGRSVDEAFGFTESAPPLSGEALKVARDFDNLSPYGKRRVQAEIEKQQMFNRHLYENLRIVRTKRDLTQQKLADKSKIPLARIQKFEAEDGQTQLADLIRAEEIVQIAKALEISPLVLMGLNLTYEQMQSALKQGRETAEGAEPKGQE